MKPQHLLLSVPIVLGVIAVDAFIVSLDGTRFHTGESADDLYRSKILNMALRGYEIRNDLRRSVSTTDLLLPTCDSSETVLLPQLRPIIPIEAAEAAHGMPWRTTIGNTDKDDPLLYMPFWEWQMKFMKESLTNLRPDEDALGAFSLMENREKKARIVNQCYTSDEYRKIRMTYYDAGDNTQVFNSVFYPRDVYNLPILGIDLLAFNRKKYLAIVDFQPLHEVESLHSSRFEHRMKPIKDSYKSLSGKMSSRFYDETKFFSNQMLFSRFEDESVVSKELFPAFQRYVKLHAKLVRETVPDTSNSSRKLIQERHQAYDTYSAERDPATGLFAAMFGKEWAEKFVFEFLFSQSCKA